MSSEPGRVDPAEITAVPRFGALLVVVTLLVVGFAFPQIPGLAPSPCEQPAAAEAALKLLRGDWRGPVGRRLRVELQPLAVTVDGVRAEAKILGPPRSEGLALEFGPPGQRSTLELSCHRADGFQIVSGRALLRVGPRSDTSWWLQ